MRSQRIGLKAAEYARSEAFHAEAPGFPVAGQVPGKDIGSVDIGGAAIELAQGPAGDMRLAVSRDPDGNALGLIHSPTLTRRRS